MSTPTNTRQLSHALTAVATLIDGVQPHQRAAPTPCPEWNARTLVRHLVGGHLYFAAVLTEAPAPDFADLRLGDDPAETFRDTGPRLEAAFADDRVYDRTYPHPLRAMTGLELLHLRVGEIVVHGWDLATATAQSTSLLSDELVEPELEFARARMSEIARGPGQMIGHEQPVDPTATAIDPFAAYLGRAVTA